MSSVDRAARTRPSDRRRLSWTDRLILVFVALVALAVGWVFAVSFLPRWWAQRVGEVADGSVTAGVFSGLTCGIVFTAVPLALLRPVGRRRTSRRLRIALLVVAALAAVPNLTTLGIVVGSGDAARAGEQILDAGAPGFRGATLVGAILGAAGLLVLWGLLYGRRRRRQELADLRAQLRRREVEEAEAAQGAEDGDEGDLDGEGLDDGSGGDSSSDGSDGD